MGITSVERSQSAVTDSVNQIDLALLGCLEKLTSCIDVHQATDYILASLREQTSADAVRVFRASRDGKLKIIGQSGLTASEPSAEISYELFDAWCPETEHQQCIIVDKSHPSEPPILSGMPFEVLAAFPLILSGQFSGFTIVENPAISRSSLPSLMPAFGFLISSVVQRAETAEALRLASSHDTLTGLHNRQQYMQELHHPDLVHADLGIIFVDINGLKNINDLYGHAYGDNIIIKTAEIMSNTFPHDTIYRVSGDEFVALCSGITEIDFYERIADLKSAFLLEPDCTASLGYLWEAECSNAEHLAADADSLMYQNKRNFYRNNPSAGRYRTYNDDILGLSNPGVLQREIMAKNFLVYFQPKYGIRTLQPIGSEALVRYHRPGGTVISPDQFIPALEDARLIGLIDFYVFGEVCDKIREWLTEGYPVTPVSVNFSRYSILEKNFVQKLVSVWSEYHIPQNLLEIEITETVGSIDINSITDLLRQIREAGFPISIDDFGVRYANLSLLLHAQVDTLKLDKSLLAGLETSENTNILIRSIAQICKEMHIRFIVEGVETQAQLEILSRYDCDGAQGFLFSKPIPIEDFEWLVYQKPKGR